MVARRKVGTYWQLEEKNLEIIPMQLESLMTKRLTNFLHQGILGHISLPPSKELCGGSYPYTLDSEQEMGHESYAGVIFLYKKILKVKSILPGFVSVDPKQEMVKKTKPSVHLIHLYLKIPLIDVLSNFTQKIYDTSSERKLSFWIFLFSSCPTETRVD